jgi:hypothetical protein
MAARSWRRSEPVSGINLRLRRFGVIAVLVAAVALIGISTVRADDDDDSGADVKVAKLVNGRCEKPTDSLPVLISRAGARPGEDAGDVTICVTNSGDSTALLSLRVLELADVDPACTGAEATRDTTCGGGKHGELGSSLLQQVGLGACPSVPPATNPALDRRLPTLQSSSLVLVDRLGRRQVICVRLRLRYEPPDVDASIASQSDRTKWRYAFTLTARR